MSRLGIASQSVFGMPPIEYVGLAADLGCGHISTGLGPVPWNPCNFLPWSLRDDSNLRREMKAAMRERGISISLAEGFIVRPNIDVRDLASDLDLMAELGARAVGTVIMEPDKGRALEQLAALAKMAAERSMGLTLEFAPPHPINNLESSMAAIRHIGMPNARLMIDAMHFFRSGGAITEIAALDPNLIGYVQLCDAPTVSRHETYMREASFDRLMPGQGELPLGDLLAVLPTDLPVGLEVPMLSEIEAGRDLRSVITRAVEAARKLLEAIEDSTQMPRGVAATP